MTVRNYTITNTVTLVTENCCSCGVVFAMPDSLKEARLRDGGRFFCPSGHGMSYTDNLEARNKALAEQLEGEKRRREAALRETERLQGRLEVSQRQTAAQKGQVTKLKNRAANGVCPCCNRYFANVHRHMKSQHPDFAIPDAGTPS